MIRQAPASASFPFSFPTEFHASMSSSEFRAPRTTHDNEGDNMSRRMNSRFYLCWQASRIVSWGDCGWPLEHGWKQGLLYRRCNAQVLLRIFQLQMVAEEAEKACLHSRGLKWPAGGVHDCSRSSQMISQHSCCLAVLSHPPCQLPQSGRYQNRWLTHTEI
jgi:hypothetical protein